MPGLVLHYIDADEGLKLEAVGRKQNYVVKSSHDSKTLVEWLKLRSFDVMLLHVSTDIPLQQELAGLLWKANPAAMLLLYDFREQGRVNHNEARLFGAEVLRGESLLSQIEEHLQRASQLPVIKFEDFHIMVVEDLDSPRDIICFFVESMGYPAVKGCRSAREALVELERAPDHWSCVITDIKMPEMNGVQLIESVRANAALSHLPLIALTAHGTADCLIDCLRAGVSGFLVKPPRKVDLTRELSRALRIISRHSEPRLVQEHDLQGMIDVLLERGL